MAVRTHIGNFSIFQITFRMSGVPPLTDEASIRRNNDFLHILAYAEYPLHIFIRSGSSKDIESVISTVGGQFQYIALASHTIQLFTCLQFERHSMHIHLGRYQFSSIRITRLKVGSSLELVPTEALLIINKGQWFGHRLHLFIGSKTYLVGLNAVWID